MGGHKMIEMELYYAEVAQSKDRFNVVFRTSVNKEMLADLIRMSRSGFIDMWVKNDE